MGALAFGWSVLTNFVDMLICSMYGIFSVAFGVYKCVCKSNVHLYKGKVLCKVFQTYSILIHWYSRDLDIQLKKDSEIKTMGEHG